MKKYIFTALLVGAFSVAGVAAAQTQPPAPAAKHASSATAATHAMKGTVKSIDDTTLVLTRNGGNHSDMTFTLNSATHREGTLAAGTAVSVRYREEGKTHVATAVRVEPVKKSTAHSTTPKR